MASSTFRVSPRPDAQLVQSAFTGRSFTPAGTPFADVDERTASQLASFGWTRPIRVGPTSGRPTAADPGAGGMAIVPLGAFYIDTTVNKLVLCVADGKWIDPVTGLMA